MFACFNGKYILRSCTFKEKETVLRQRTVWTGEVFHLEIEAIVHCARQSTRHVRCIGPQEGLKCWGQMKSTFLLEEVKSFQVILPDVQQTPVNLHRASRWLGGKATQHGATM